MWGGVIVVGRARRFARFNGWWCRSSARIISLAAGIGIDRKYYSKELEQIAGWFTMRCCRTCGMFSRWDTLSGTKISDLRLNAISDEIHPPSHTNKRFTYLFSRLFR